MLVDMRIVKQQNHRHLCTVCNIFCTCRYLSDPVPCGECHVGLYHHANSKRPRTALLGRHFAPGNHLARNLCHGKRSESHGDALQPHHRSPGTAQHAVPSFNTRIQKLIRRQPCRQKPFRRSASVAPFQGTIINQRLPTHILTNPLPEPSRAFPLPGTARLNMAGTAIPE